MTNNHKHVAQEITLLRRIIKTMEQYGNITRGLDVISDLERYREWLQETIAEREGAN